MLVTLTHRELKPENHSLGFEGSLGYIWREIFCVGDW